MQKIRQFSFQRE